MIVREISKSCMRTGDFLGCAHLNEIWEEDETSGVLPASSEILLTRITLNTCRDFARPAGSIEVGNVLSKDGAEVVFADTFGISFTSEGPCSHIDVCGKPCPYAFEEKVSMGR